MPATRDAPHPITSLLTAVVSEVSYLLQTEIRMARTEVKENLGRMASGGAMLGAAAVIAIPGAVVLLFAISRWLTVAGMPEEWSLTLVGVVILAIAVVLAMTGIKALKASSLLPERTIDQVRADFSIAKEQVP